MPFFPGFPVIQLHLPFSTVRELGSIPKNFQNIRTSFYPTGLLDLHSKRNPGFQKKYWPTYMIFYLLIFDLFVPTKQIISQIKF